MARAPASTIRSALRAMLHDIGAGAREGADQMAPRGGMYGAYAGGVLGGLQGGANANYQDDDLQEAGQGALAGAGGGLLAGVAGGAALGAGLGGARGLRSALARAIREEAPRSRSFIGPEALSAQRGGGEALGGLTAPASDLEMLSTLRRTLRALEREREMTPDDAPEAQQLDMQIAMLRQELESM